VPDSSAAPWSGLACLIICLIIQTIRRDPSGAVQIDEASNVSRPDPSGPDQIDAEHRPTGLMIVADHVSPGVSPPAITRPDSGGLDGFST
jgi:hypothetical protein